MSEDRKKLAGQAFTALKWNYVGALARVGSQVIIGIVLARILGPKPFGLVAIAWLVIGLGNLIADFGFGAALVQRKTITESEVRYVFTVQVLLGFGLTLFIISSAGLAAQFFKEPEAVPVLRALSLIFLIQALGQTAVNLLRRNLDFKSIQLAQVLSYVVSFLILGIPLAYAGFGVWSLVAAQLSQNLLYNLMAYFRIRHTIKPLLINDNAGFFSFGAKVTVNNLVNWSISNVDNIVIGKVFGVVALGLYSRATVLLVTPMGSIVPILQGVLFPAYSKTQDNNEAIKQVYLASVSIVALIMLPLLGNMAVVPHTVIEGLYGKRWLGAVPLLVPLALAMPFDGMMALSGPLLWGKGKVERELRAQAVSCLLFILVLIITSRISLIAMIWGVFGIYVVRFVLTTREVLQVVNASWWEMLKTLRGSVLLLAGTGLAVSGVDAFLLFHGAPPLFRLLNDAFVGTAATILLFLAFPKVVLSADITWIFERLSNKLPPILRWLVAYTNRSRLRK